MRFFLTRLHDWGATPAGALVRPKDPMEYERKLAVHRAAPDLVLFGAPAGRRRSLSTQTALVPAIRGRAAGARSCSPAARPAS
jgi:hypothetical protein